MKNTFVKLFAAGLSGAMLFSFAACGDDSATSKTPASYVGIDVNPSVSLVLDKNDKVLSVIADNEDAQVLLLDVNLVGMDAGDAAKKVAELSVELGYLNEENRGIALTIEGMADAKKLSADIQASFSAAADDLQLRFTSEGTFSVNRRLAALKAEYPGDAEIQSLTAGKYKLIAEAQTANRSLSVTTAANMDVSALLDVIGEKADEIKPYATAAYTTAKKAAARVYNDAKGQLLDGVWLTPYLKPEYISEILTGKRVHYGVIYNLYTASARTLAAGIDAAEAAAAAAEKTPVSDAVLNAVAQTLGLSEAEETAFLESVEKDGKTVAALDRYLNAYFKNMTAEQLAAAKDKLQKVMEKVQEEADKIDAAVAAEYKAALEKLCSDLEKAVPDSVKETAGAYLTEFTDAVKQLKDAASGKEPLPAAYAALETLKTRTEKVLETMKADLEKEDVDSVYKTIETLQEQLTSFEKAYNEAVAKAEQEAKAYLSALREARTQKAA